MKFLDQVLDAVDIETVVKCSTEPEARRLATEWLRELGFQDVDVVFLEHSSFGVRVRARAYVHRPGDRYAWLVGASGEAQSRGDR